MEKPKIYSINELPTEKDPEGDGWSKDIMLISGENEFRGYYDPEGSVAGGKFKFYEDNSIKDCATLKEFPTHWYYIQN